MDYFKDIFITLPFFFLSLVPITICIIYVLISARLILKGKREEDEIKVKNGKKGLTISLLMFSLFISLLVIIYKW